MVAPDRDKLRRAFGTRAPDRSGCAAAPAPTSPEGGMRAFLQRRHDRLLPPTRPPVSLPAAEEHVTGHGPMWRRELRYPWSMQHGRVPLGAAMQLDGARLAILAKEPSFATLDLRECLFLDTETTGLAGGAGTIVFAYGMAFVDGDELVVEQLFLRDFGEEPAMLHHLARRLGERPVPVTFVGKSYDRHRIAARLALHKVKAPVLTARHLDLYHVVRRAHGANLPDARLRTVEQHLLGFCRHDDLPGSEAPAAFLDWMRDRSGPVDRVLEHNRLDVLSLVALLGVLAGAGGDALAGRAAPAGRG